MPFGKMMLYAVLLSIPIVVGALLIGFFVEDGPVGVGIAMSFCFAMMAIIIVAAVQMAAYFRAPTWAIVLDKKENIHYIVQQPTQSGGGWDTASRLAGLAAQSAEVETLSRIAQIDSIMVDAVKKYQSGEMKRTVFQKLFETPEFIVIKLQNPEIVKEKKKSITLSYEKENGKRKKIKIANAYSGFEIGQK
jgi:hypothetical protein